MRADFELDRLFYKRISKGPLTVGELEELYDVHSGLGMRVIRRMKDTYPDLATFRVFRKTFVFLDTKKHRRMTLTIIKRMFPKKFEHRTPWINVGIVVRGLKIYKNRW